MKILSWSCFGGTALVYGILSASVFAQSEFPWRDVFVIGTAALWAVHDLVFSWGVGRVRRRWYWLVPALVVLAVAVILWLMYHGVPKMGTDCLGGYAGHAVWHVLTACVVLLGFLHFRSERHGRM